ncbi:MAG: hypothetical protein MHPDNHAH_02258 [Anaerolineales bacterium]|nr:hypothetical protein [Anaerolineales bacterium]
MKISQIKITWLIILLSALVVSDTGCAPADNRVEFYPNSISKYPQSGQYYINPETILVALAHGEKKVFTPVLTMPEVHITPLAEGSSYLWQFSDYIVVASALQQQIWSEDMQDWSLFSMRFYVDCQGKPNGFSIGDFVFYKEITMQEEKSYSYREILIRPLYGDISWGAEAVYPRPSSGWKKVELETVKVDADEALDIAEKNGGEDFRLSLNNDCQVSLTYNENFEYKGWVVLVSRIGGVRQFKIYIDASSSEYEIIRSD